jgi:hypothetical protein
MPIWLRRFTFNQIQQYNIKQQEEINNAKTGNKGQKTLIDTSGRVNTPEFLKTSEQYKKPAKWK